MPCREPRGSEHRRGGCSLQAILGCFGILLFPLTLLYVVKCVARFYTDWTVIGKEMIKAEDRYPVPHDYEGKALSGLSAWPRIEYKYTAHRRPIVLYWNEKGLLVWVDTGGPLSPTSLPPRERRFMVPWGSFGTPYRTDIPWWKRIPPFWLTSFMVVLPIRDLDLLVIVRPKGYEAISHLLPDGPRKAEQVEAPPNGG